MVPAKFTADCEAASHLILLRIAREIAIDHYPIETILENNKINPDQWDQIKTNPEFLRLLESEVAAWSSALNTLERTKLKAAALIEEFLPEANARLHDKGENLNAKVELAKLLSRIGGMGLNNIGVEGASEKFSVTINLGASEKLTFEKQLPTQVIDAEAE